MNHEHWMNFSLKEAEIAFQKNEVPVGAVVVYEDRIIGRGHNMVETLNDPTAHAEIIALSAAANNIHSPRLEDCSVYVTLEPCTMCAGAIVLSKIKKLIYGAADPKTGVCGSLYNIVQDKRLNHQTKIITGILELDCSYILKDFFHRLRSKAISY